ncbi:unnamed protein product [Ectocarpus sp. 12 AP-2014]
MVLKTLTAMRGAVETVQQNRDELAALEKRCTYMTACVIVKFRQIPHAGSGPNVTPLEDCVTEAEKFAERRKKRRMIWKIVKVFSIKDELATMNTRIDRLLGDLGLAGIATVLGEVVDSKGILEQMVQNQAAARKELLANQEIIIDRLPKPPIKQAHVPQGTPTRKSWHVERRHVMETVVEALTGEARPRLVGLVGDSGAGKTTAASEIVRSNVVRETSSGGIVWLTVNNGAKDRLPSLMLQLARMVHEDIGGRVGGQPKESGDNADAYIKQRMENGPGGKGLKCLVVADNVWEKEVVSMLLKNGMTVLLSTRHEELVTGALGVPVRVDELSSEDAESVLRSAAELPPEVRLPDDAVDLIDLCGRVAMDLAFVGRWSIVRGRHDRAAWSDAAAKVRSEIAKIEGGGTAGNARGNRRKSILQAGLEDLAIGSDDERVQRLYLSLAVLPDGQRFLVHDAALLLHDRDPTAEDEESVARVLDVLERWSVLRSTWAFEFYMHDAHSEFARENLMDRGDVRRHALRRWVGHISSLDTLMSHSAGYIRRQWLGVEQVGGEGWDKTRPYEAALAEMDDSDPLLQDSIMAVAKVQEAHEDWEKASTMWRRLLVVSNWWNLFLDGDDEHRFRALFEGSAPGIVTVSLPHLITCARKKNSIVEEAEWREKLFEDIVPYVIVWFAEQNREKIEENMEENLEESCRLCSIVSFGVILNDREMEKVLRRCLVLFKARVGPEDVWVARTLRDLGVVLHWAEHLGEAEGLLRKSLALNEAKRGPADAGVASELGVCARKRGDTDNAEEMIRQALKMQEINNLNPDGLETGLTFYELGACTRESKRFEKGELLLRRSLDIMEKHARRCDRWMANVLSELGICAREAGRPVEEVEDLLRRSTQYKDGELAFEGQVRNRTDCVIS